MKKLVLLWALILTLMITACSGATETGNVEKEKQEPPTEISVLVKSRAAQFPDSSNPVWKEIEKRTNTKLNIQYASANNFEEKVNVTLASGDMPDVVIVENFGSPVIKNMMNQGVFWDLGPLLKDFPSMLNLPKDSWEDIKYNNGYYGIPRYLAKVGGGAFPMIRKDWLDKVGLPVPKTYDDLYKVLKAFKEKDPDGNGKDDTIPLVFDIPRSQWIWRGFNNSQGDWVERDGKLSHIALQPETRESLVWANKLYKEGLMHQEFSILKSSQVFELMNGNKSGVVPLSMTQAWPITSELRKSVPQAEMYPLEFLEGPRGKYVFTTPAYFGVSMINKKVPEAKVRKIMKLFEFGHSPEGSNLAFYGIQNVHYTEANGKKELTDKYKTDLVEENFSVLFAPINKYANVVSAGAPDSFFERNKKILDEREKNSTPNYQDKLYSETWTKVGTDIIKKIDDTRIKVIMGVEPISAWDALVDKYKADAEFQKIIKEINDSFKK